MYDVNRRETFEQSELWSLPFLPYLASGTTTFNKVRTEFEASHVCA